MTTREIEARVASKVTWRLIPFLLLLYLVAYIDRANISFAALEMNKSLGFDASTYGFAAGIFFIGYFLFEVPSNMLLGRFGARVWITRILVTWGAIVVLTGFVQNALQLNILRFLLGVAEAGFFPGVILYLTFWYPKRQLARIVAMFMTAVPIAFVVGAPVSTWIMQNASGLGLEGWRWMFIIEGLLAVILGPITYFVLIDGPQNARWLSADEKACLIHQLSAEEAAITNPTAETGGAAFKNPKTWYLSVLYFLYITGTLGLMYFLPQLIKQLSAQLSAVEVGLTMAVPYLVGAVAMNYWGRRSAARDERRLHAAFPLLMVVGAYAALSVTAGKSSVILVVLILCVAVAGMLSFNGPFWAIPPKFMTGAGAAAGIAIVNSSGNLGGFAGPFAMGYLKDATGGTAAGLAVLSASLLCAAAMLVGLRKAQA